MERFIDTALKALNSAFEADPVAIHTLLINRVPCNDALAEHPLVPVQQYPGYNPKRYGVGTMGLINCVLDAIGAGRVAAKWSEEADDEGRHTLEGFVEFVDPNGRVAT